MYDKSGSVTPPKRVDPPMAADERTMLSSWLEWHRATVHDKCAGLDPALSSAAPFVSSPMTTIGGIVSHLRWVEAFWFEVVLLNQPDVAPYSAQDPDGEFRVGAERPLGELLIEYERQCERSREITSHLDLGNFSRRVLRDGRGRTTLRWVLTHMIEETARHNGHLDLLRESADGTVGA
ncbi:DinB family protein [Nocardiopsis sp. MG754419]|uniref:DinB family protein n=1 Tax=Nocardiopsis sp. MG754419 TaxID=2259865 RepID=UPI001BA4F92D|nr:DinB family protein [Nocardiopsis sp. MG754419]MBR8741545.1 mini-circle protein [Nocardiopsis sp. MG754419]